MRDPMTMFGSQRAPVNPARPPTLAAAWAADLETVGLHQTGTADPFRRYGWNAFAMRLRHARRKRSPTLLWISCGSCSGESMSILGVDGQATDFLDLLEHDGVRLLWHPSLSLEPLAPIADQVLHRTVPLTLMCVEGSLAMGPDGTGLFDTFDGKPKRDLVYELCSVADYVLALGTCASYGGIPAAPPNPTTAVGLQYADGAPGGLLGKDWRSRKGLPVVNVAGCAADTDTMLAAMRWLLAGDADPGRLDRLGRPSFVRPCLSPADRPKCGTAQWVGHSCYGCIGQKFPLSRDLLKWTEARKCASESVLT